MMFALQVPECTSEFLGPLRVTHKITLHFQMQEQGGITGSPLSVSHRTHMEEWKSKMPRAGLKCLGWCRLCVQSAQIQHTANIQPYLSHLLL